MVAAALIEIIISKEFIKIVFECSSIIGSLLQLFWTTSIRYQVSCGLIAHPANYRPISVLHISPKVAATPGPGACTGSSFLSKGRRLT